MPRPTHSPWFDLPNDIWWRVQIVKLPFLKLFSFLLICHLFLRKRRFSDEPRFKQRILALFIHALHIKNAVCSLWHRLKCLNFPEDLPSRYQDNTYKKAITASFHIPNNPSSCPVVLQYFRNAM
jgi:hypothetical protein